jgi:hypothetical protein
MIPPIPSSPLYESEQHLHTCSTRKFDADGLTAHCTRHSVVVANFESQSIRRTNIKNAGLRKYPNSRLLQTSAITFELLVILAELHISPRGHNLLRNAKISIEPVKRLPNYLVSWWDVTRVKQGIMLVLEGSAQGAEKRKLACI